MKKLYLLLFVFTSCAPVYVPNIRNTPMFKGAGEFQGAIQFGNGFDAQTALSVTNHIGIMGNFSYADRSGIDDPDHYHYHKFYEGGLGYYTNMEEACFEIFTGYGKGKGSAFDEFTIFGSMDATRGKGKFNRFFVQPAIGFNKKTVHVSFSSRLSFVDMYEFTDETNSITYPNSETAVFIEPAVVGKVNLADDHLFFTFQAGGSALVSGENAWTYRPFQWSMGMGFRLGGNKKVE